MASKPAPTRPWFISALLPVLLMMAGLTISMLDGFDPYRSWMRRQTWKPVKGRLASSVERRHQVRTSAQGNTRLEYLAKRAQRRVFSKVVTRGWPLSQKKRVWIVKVTYTYPWKKGRITRVADSPKKEFDSKGEAQAYLSKRIQQGSIKVWVNPKDPHEATAFLGSLYTTYVVLGSVLFDLGLLWMIVAWLMRRAHVRQEGV